MKRYGLNLLLILLLHTVYLSAQASDFYWIGGSGNFNDIEHWSDQPGGKVNPAGLVPDKDDNVYFDQFSFPDPGAVVTITNVARCNNMHWGDVKNMPRFTADSNLAHYLVIYGGVTFSKNMILDLNRPLYFRASSLGNVIDMGGNSFDGDFIFENNGGWRITSTLDLQGNDINFNKGTLSFEAEVNCGRILSETTVTRELYLNSAVINLTSSGNAVLSVQTDNLSVYPDLSTINVLSDQSSIETTGSKRIEFYDVVFKGDNGFVTTSAIQATFNKLTFEKNGSLSGENDFQELVFTQGYSYDIDSNGVQNVQGMFTAKGECYAYINVLGASGGGFISADAVDLNYLKVSNITASGAAVNFTANNSYNLGGNTGWVFGAPTSDDYTWTGAGADNKWGNHLNWDKGCVPSRNNNAIIPAGFTVEVDVPAECKSLTIDDNSTFAGSGSIEIFASLAAGNSTWTYTGDTYFKGSAAGNNIEINSVMPGAVIVDGTGDWTLIADLSLDNVLNLNSGVLNANGFSISAKTFVSSSTAIRTFDLTNSDITITDGVNKAWDVEGSNLTVNGNGSKITFTQSGAEMYNNSSDLIHYGKVLFNPIDNQVMLTNDNSGSEPVFDAVKFNGNAKISGDNQYSKLELTKGKEYLFAAGSKQKILIEDGFIAHGTCSEYISLTGDGGIAYFDCDVNSADLFRLRIKDVNVIGGLAGTLKANESIGVSGYEGWVFPDDLTGKDIYWTGNSGTTDWFEAGNWDSGCIPTRKDNVFFTDVKVGGSFEVNISTKGKIAECNNMTWTAAGGMTFSGDQDLNVFGSLDLSGLAAGNISFSGNINFKAEADPQTISMGAAQLLSDLNFEGNQQEDASWLAGSWTITTDLITTGAINLERGDVIVNDKNIETKEFYSNYGSDNARSLNLGASVLRAENIEISAENFTLSAGTSEIQLTKAGKFIISTGDKSLAFNNLTYEESNGNSYLDIFADDVSFNDMVFKGNTYFRKINTSKIGFTANSIQMAVGKTYVFESGQTYEFGNIIANGACEGTIDITGSDSDAAIFQAKSGVSNITVSSVNLLNVHAVPNNVFVANASLDLGNTDGWSFNNEPTGKDLYWVGGTGSWDDPNHWSTTSGGTPDGCVPTAKDNVFFDGGSFDDFDQVVSTGAGDIRCRTMDWTGSASARPKFQMGATDISAVYIYGSFILNNQVDVDLSPFVNFYFRATEAQTINTFGYVFPNNVEFDGKNGAWTMNSDFQADGDVFIRQGQVVANGNPMECNSITSIDQPAGVNSRGLDISNTTLTINGSEPVSGRSLYLNLADEYYDQGFQLLADNSTIKFTNDADLILIGTSTQSINFNELVFEKAGLFDAGYFGLDAHASHLLFMGNGDINGKKNSFGTLELSRGFEFKLEKGRTIETDNLIVNGSCFAPIYLHSSVIGQTTTIKAKNNVTGNFLQLQDVTVDTSGGITYTAANSFDLGNVSGWDIDNVVAPISLYWTGNGADDDWNNHENWSRAADGSEEGCVPTLNDDVYFTANSFLGSKLVEISSDAACHSMFWQDDIDPEASFSVQAKLQIGGSMDLANAMSISMQGTFEFVGDAVNDIKIVDFADKSFDGDIKFNGNGQSWEWKTGFTSSKDLYVEAGSVSTGAFDFTIRRFSSLSLDDFSAVRKFDMSGSLVTVTSDETTGWNMKMNTTGGLDFVSTDSKITFINGGGIYCETDGDVNFGFIDFVGSGVININSSSNTEKGHFGSVKFQEEGKVFGTNTFSNLEFTLGYEENTIEAGKTVTVENDLVMEGVRCSYVFLKSSQAGIPATIYKPGGVFNKIYNASLTDIKGLSGTGADHPVHYKYDDNASSTGFVLEVDPSGEDNPPSFEESFDQPKEEWCSNIATLDHVLGFPVNNSTTYQWYFSADGTTYSAMPGETNAVIEVDKSGFYKVEVRYDLTNNTDGSECKIESVIEVSLGTVSNVALEITANNVRCYGANDGRVIAKVATIQYPDYQFYWKDENGVEPSNSTNTTTWENTAFNLAPGKYYVTVADGKNCEFDTIVNVFDAYKLSIDTIYKKDLTCYTVPEGEIKIEANGGTGNLSYYLDDVAQASENITGLTSGNYQVYVQDENSCKTDVKDISIDSNPEITIDLNGLDLKCYNDNTGKFSPAVAGGVPSYTYAWSGPSAYSSGDLNISGLSGGLYQLSVTDQVGCVATKEQELFEPTELIASELVVEPANCNGEATGEIFVVGGQGTPNYRYFLDGEEEMSGLFTGLAPENYALQIVDAHGCIFDKEIEVSEPAKLGFLVADKVLPSCEKTEDGIIHVTPYGGNEGYSFSWTGPNDFVSHQQNIENIIAGKYSLQITDKKNCSSIDTVDLKLGLQLQLGVVVEQHVTTTGGNNGSLSLEFFEGKIPYTFTVTGPNGTTNSPDFFDDHYYLMENLPAGVYTVVATDASSCTTQEKTVIIEEPGSVFAYIKQIQGIQCAGNSDGELAAIVSGGTGTYTYNWSGPSGFTANTQAVSGLAPGTYTVTVSDGSSTYTSNSFNLLPADPILVTVDSYKDVTCYQSADGEIQLAVDAGGADYTIKWTGANGFLSSAKHLIDLLPGTYNYEVTTNAGCAVSGNQAITEPTPLNLSVSTTDITAEGLRDGTVTANFSGGTPPYTVLISGPNGYSYSDLNNTSGTATVNGLEMGIYEVAIIDDNGCRIENSKKVHEPTKLLLYPLSVTNVSCPGYNDGAISVGVDGASDPANLTFSWEADNHFRSTDKNISNLYAGTYKLSIHDSGGDPGYEDQSIIVIVSEPDPLKIEYNTVNVSCYNRSDAYINIDPQGGTPAYQFFWEGTGVAANNEDQSMLAPGIYKVSMIDANGCKSDTTAIEITQPDELLVSVADSKEPTCYGLENGWIQLDIQSGTEPYTINWDNYGSVTQRIEELTRGLYKYTVTDDNGCSASNSITLNQPDTLIAEINTSQDVKCYGESSGTALVDISGGTPDYTILWSDGQDTQEATDLKIGKYEVSIIDAQGCKDTSSVVIEQPEPLAMKVEAIRPTTYDANDGAIAVNVTGGIPDYIYNWEDQDLNSYKGAEIGDLERGSYHLELVDQNNCMVDTTINLEYLFENRIRIPKAFTPNADGYNDYWDIDRIEFIQNLKIVIYDRWGKAVYKFSGTGNEYKGTPWTGVDGTQKLPIGSYYYAVSVDEEKPILGTVTILR